MEKVKLICIGCPLSCPMEVELAEEGVVSVTGNTCKNGDRYARREVINPVRTVTGSVRVIGGKRRVVSVKTAAEIPKGKLFDCARALKDVEVTAPVRIGDVILENVAGTGVNVVATNNMPRG